MALMSPQGVTENYTSSDIIDDGSGSDSIFSQVLSVAGSVATNVIRAEQQPQLQQQAAAQQISMTTLILIGVAIYFITK